MDGNDGIPLAAHCLPPARSDRPRPRVARRGTGYLLPGVRGPPVRPEQRLARPAGTRPVRGIGDSLPALYGDQGARFTGDRGEKSAQAEAGRPAFGLRLAWTPAGVTRGCRLLAVAGATAHLQRKRSVTLLCHAARHIDNAATLCYNFSVTLAVPT